MKNLPARVRAKSRARSSYNRNGKTEYQYPRWVGNAKRQISPEPPPENIAAPLRRQWRAICNLPLPAHLVERSLI